MKQISIQHIELPDFGRSEIIPEIPARVYQARQARLRQRMEEAGFDGLLVYADREHSANLSYLTGFDPRFEEALLVVPTGGETRLIVGNENLGVLSALPVPCEAMLCQEFSLMGQDRSVSWDLKPLLAEAGVTSGMRCGCIGWKSLMEGRIELPAWIVDLVRDATAIELINANDMLMHPADGMRMVNEPEQIAFFEYAATHTSDSILALLRDLEPGRRGSDLARAYDGGGLPHSCHPMLSFGREIPNGMASPVSSRLAEGDILTAAFGIWGALNCRAGLVVSSVEAFAVGIGPAMRAVMENYLSVLHGWYAALEIDAVAGDIWAAAEECRDDDLYTFCVNPGHYLHLDEWVSSPFCEGSQLRLPSGAAIQADIIPVARAKGVSVNMEDGVVLADAALRDVLRERYPEMMARCEARRAFMVETLGYVVSESVLPLSNIPGVYFPCLLDTGLVCRFCNH